MCSTSGQERASFQGICTVTVQNGQGQICRKNKSHKRNVFQGMDIDYYVSAAECTAFSDQSFDVITACQCFWYFDPVRSMPNFYRMLKPDGRLLVLSMAWLPFEDRIAEASEKLVLKYNPTWSGAGETVHPIPIPKEYDQKFERIYHEEYRFSVPFTRDSWNGRMKTCRGLALLLQKQKFPHGKQNIKNCFL